ncbi:retropepsin-like aspartic protease [Chitinibacteraceae bacterium HSL-7]
MTHAEPQTKHWAPRPDSLTPDQQNRLEHIYQLMLTARHTEAETQLARLYTETPAVLPQWIALLTELQHYARIRQLVADGVIPPTHSSAVIAQAYNDAPQPTVRFGEAHGTLPLQSHWLVDLPRIRIELGGQAYYFVLDTGASQSLITDRVASALQLPPASASSVEIDTATDRTVSAALVRLPDLQIGPALASHQLAVVVHAEALEPRFLGMRWYRLDGILGWPILRELDLTLDFASQTLEISAPATSAEPGNLVWLFDDPMVITDQDAEPRLWFLDTGAMTSQLTPDYLNAEQYQATRWSKKRFNGLGGKGQHEETGEFGPVRIAFPSFTRHFKRLAVRAGHQDCTLSRCDGRLGTDIANKGRMRIHYRAGRFDVTPAR